MKWSPLSLALSGAMALMLAGCSSEPEAAPPPQTVAKPSSSVPAPADTAVARTAPPLPSDEKAPAMASEGKTMPTAGNAPYASGKSLTAEEALKQVPTLYPKFAPMQKAMDDSEAALKKSPGDAKLKTAYVEATYNYGHAVMEDGQEQPRVMYRAALALYRRALKVDPQHKPSLEDKQMIENIYRGMPSGIPR